MEKSGSPPSKKDSEFKDNEGSGDSNEWSDISSSSDEGGNEGKLEKKNSTSYSSCCKKRQKKSQPRNWFGEKGTSEGSELHQISPK